ncbi:hypothetical protein IC582_007835 [Cucumis melo]
MLWSQTTKKRRGRPMIWKHLRLRQLIGRSILESVKMACEVLMGGQILFSFSSP